MMIKKIREVTANIQRKKAKRLLTHYSLWLHKTISTTPYLSDMAPADQWQIRKIYRSASDMITCWIGSSDPIISFILYIPKSRIAYQSFEKRKKIMQLLQDKENLGEWRNFLPKILYEGEFEKQSFWVEKCLPGLSGLDAMRNTDDRQTILLSAIAVIKHLHLKTMKETIVDDALLKKWIRIPLEQIIHSPLVYLYRPSRIILKKLGKELEESLNGKKVITGWIHGDFWPGNILVDPNSNKVIGLVDWEDFEMDFPLSFDLVNMMVSTRRVGNTNELGAIILALLKEDAWHTNEMLIWKEQEEKLGGHYLPLRESLLLFWLHHISVSLKKSWHYSANPLWIYGNFINLLKYLQRS